MKPKTVHLGFEVGTGEPVAIPLRHLAVVGQTQESGKTTTLEGLISRSDTNALAFVTKRGESSFTTGSRIAPYFRDQAGWQFVSSLLEATLQEKKRFERAWIQKACRGASSLADVQQNTRRLMADAKRSMDQDQFMLLDSYLDIVVPQIRRLPTSSRVELAPGPGLNVMDLTPYSTEMQMLVIRSALEWISAHEEHVITIIPEAWEFVPEAKGSPVKPAAEALVRKGAALGNFVWIDSQDMAGVAKVLLRAATVWLIGVQREANELKRNLANIPADIRKPKPADIARLGKGQFFACWKDRTVKVYVQPAWLDETRARAVATGELMVEDLHLIQLPRKDEPMSKEIDAKLDAIEGKLDRMLSQAQAQERVNGGGAAAPVQAPALPSHADGDSEALYQQFKARLMQEAPALVKVLAKVPELEITETRNVIEADGASLRGRLARLIHEGFFEDPISGGVVQKELARRGFNTSPGSLYPELDNLAAMGFLTVEPGKDDRARPVKKFQAVKGMKVNIVKK